MPNLKLLCAALFSVASFASNAANLAYIHGDVSEAGFTPASSATSGSTSPYDQMLITDSGRTGLSKFRALVEGENHTIEQFYDQVTTIDAGFLRNKDVLIFGLHQKMWSGAEKSALDTWIRAGGGMFIYSDSASGGFHRLVGAQNPVGQRVTNNLIAQYGMQVTVDQADGTTAHEASDTASIASLRGLRLEGEGVSPVAIAQNSSEVEVLIPYTRRVRRQQGLSINAPQFAALALRPLDEGHIIVMFDRQPMWNDGPGSDIEKRDNTVILRTVMNFLAERPTEPDEPSDPQTPRSGKAVISPVVDLILGEG